MSVLLEHRSAQSDSARPIAIDTKGLSSPLGSTVRDGGVNFSIFSRAASAVELLLFDREDDARPVRVIAIDSFTNRVSLLARVCARRATGPDLRLSSARPPRPCKRDAV